jgi:hypothetical protein
VGRSDVHDEIRSGRPSVVTDEIIQKTEYIHADKRLTINELHQQCPEVSRTVLHEIFTKRLGHWKLCTRWVSKMLKDDHKKNGVAAGQAFLACYGDQGDNFLNCIVTGNETWVSHLIYENKRQSMQLRHTHSLTAKKIQNFTNKQKNHGNHLLAQKGAISHQFFALRRHHQCCCLL